MILALRNRKLKELLKLEDDMEIAAVIPFGHPASSPGKKGCGWSEHEATYQSI